MDTQEVEPFEAVAEAEAEAEAEDTEDQDMTLEEYVEFLEGEVERLVGEVEEWRLNYENVHEAYVQATG